MIKSFAVYHSKKGTGSGGGLGNHIDRVEGMEHTYRNANPKMSIANIEYAKNYKDMSLPKAIETRLKKGYNGKRKIRSDAKKYVANIFTGSHRRMYEMFCNPEESKKWISENYKFACREFGEENIVRFTLHLDEKTPHIHCVVVPLTKDGRLSAKEVVGNRNDLKLRQDRYAEAMAQFGLERGVSRDITQNRHETGQEYQTRLRNFQENSKFKVDLSPVKTLGVVRGAKTIEKLSNQLKQAEKVVNEQVAKAFKNERLYKNVFDVANKQAAKERSLKELFLEKYNKVSSKRDVLERENKIKDKMLNRAEKVLTEIVEKHNIDIQKMLDKEKSREKRQGFSR